MYVNQKYYQVPNLVEISKKRGRLTTQFDQMWYSVSSLQNKQCKELAIDADSREIVGVFIGALSAIGKAAVAILASGKPPVRYFMHRLMLGIRTG